MTASDGKTVPAVKKNASTGHLSEAVEEGIERLPNMKVARLSHLLSQGMKKKKTSLQCPLESLEINIEDVKKELLTLIEVDQMAPYYERCCTTFDWPIDAPLLAKMKEANAAELEKGEEQLADATENLGPMEVLEALFTKANLYSRIGNKDAAVNAFMDAAKKPQSINQKILIALHLIRIGLFFSDLELVKRNVTLSKTLIDEGGDWDRRNRLQVYEGCYLLLARDFKKASVFFQKSIATFTSDELLPYNTMILYCIITSVMNASRVDLKNKIVDSPEVLAVIHELPPHISGFLNGLYDCDYKKFFSSLIELSSTIEEEMYLSLHFRYIYRELRVLAYAQFLEAYRSVKLDSMAASFGISAEFLDSELSRFISAGRLNAKIDKVAGVIETNRPDAKNTQYQAVIKKGDQVLNRLQKLARVINV